jgi:nicotinic acid mononucleotide adenylyltransferase
LTSCSPIVVTRPGHEVRKSWKAVGTIISDVRGQATAEIIAAVDTSESPRTFVTDAAMTDVSATAIRQAVSEGSYNKLRTMVPQSVADYIEKHGLYRR